MRDVFFSLKNNKGWDFPGGTVLKNPPANAGDTSSSPAPGGFPYATEQLSPCTTTTEPALQSEPQLLTPACHNY